MDPMIAPFDTGLNGVNQPVNLLLSKVLWATLGLFCVIVVVFRLSLGVWATLRHVSAVTAAFDDEGSSAACYWRQPLWRWMPYLKKKLIYAPLFGYRRARKTRLFGALPTRLQAIFLAVYILSNFGYLLVLDWSDSNRYALCAEVRGRSGTLAAVNFIPLVILAGRNNPLISLLRISFDTYILIHRWIGLCPPHLPIFFTAMAPDPSPPLLFFSLLTLFRACRSDSGRYRPHPCGRLGLRPGRRRWLG